MLELIKDLWVFLKQRKKLWMAPIIAIMVILGVLLVLTQGSALAPFVYTLFSRQIDPRRPSNLSRSSNKKAIAAVNGNSFLDFTTRATSACPDH